METSASGGAPVRSLTVTQIMEAIPHRFPFLLVDRVDILEEGKIAVGRKCVTMNEQFFQGHFPGYPIMPGVLIIEALAQTACSLMFSRPEMKGKLAFFMGIDAVKFRRPVTPGDVLELHVEMLRMGSRAGRAKGTAKVNGETATEAEFSFAISDRSAGAEPGARRMPIHPTAVIDSSAKIGKDVEIGPYAVIGPGVELGDRCRIGAHTILEHTTLGTECEVYPYVSIGLRPQHLRDAGEGTRVQVGEKTIFRESVTVHRGTKIGAGVTRIGSHGFFMAYSHIAHDCIIGDHVIMANAAQLAGHVEIGDNAFISTMVGVHQFARVGQGAMISGGAMVSLDVAPYCLAQGDRAVLRGLNVVGLRRSGASRESIRRLKEAYRIVFKSGRQLLEVLQAPELQNGDSYLESFRRFLAVPKRGFTRPSERRPASANEGEAE